jgi:endoglucanase
VRTNSPRPFAVATAAALLATASCAAAPRPKPGESPGVAPDQAPPPLSGHNLLLNEAFNDPKKTLPWNASFSEPAAGRIFIGQGELCTEITNRGTSSWAAQMRHQHLTLQKGHVYSVWFKAHGSQKTRAQVKIGQSGPPYKEYWKTVVDLDTAPRVYSGRFTMAFDDDPSVELALNMGGLLAKGVTMPFTVCADDIHLDDPVFVQKPVEEGAPVPDILVNQIGYFPRLPKIATLKNAAAVPWELLDARNQKVASGTSVPFGADAASGDAVSIIDFSSFDQPGTGYTLKAGAATSHPFDIRDDLYRRLKYDALAFYYLQRSGIEIKMPFAGDPALAHPAAHVGVKPNHGDTSVPCAIGSGCNYSLDVSGGWYDAGDQGKYVVNAGISVWTLLDWWERTRAFGSSAADFADGKMNIPEAGNGVPDLLDEARWELEFELKMQVPEGHPLAGMVHHKIHDVKWTQLSLWPNDDPMERYLQPPSTAATLNLAANGAQCARIWKDIDKAFSAQCLAAAERAWTAARAHPDIFAKPGGEGGGPYDDGRVDDDFYWAAAELYITTTKQEYKDFVTGAADYKRINDDWSDNPGMHTTMTWADTFALASISLAVVPNGLPPADIAEIKKNTVAEADRYLGLEAKEGYRLPFSVPAKGYPWGSNSFVATNALIMALAHDFTRDAKYLGGVALAMDYLLGRNPMDQSYVTGYGKRPLQNPYHRFWCNQANPRFPKPPPGVLSGGPNSGMEDPYVQAAGIKGSAPQKSFIDNGEAWSANEVTINWNAPLFWIAAYLDENAPPRAAAKKERK